MSPFAISSVSTKDFFLLSENSVCKASVFFATKQFSLYSCFLKDFSQNMQTEKIEKVSHPAFLIEGKKKKKSRWMLTSHFFINCMKSSLNKQTNKQKSSLLEKNNNNWAKKKRENVVMCNFLQ